MTNTKTNEYASGYLGNPSRNMPAPAVPERGTHKRSTLNFIREVQPGALDNKSEKRISKRRFSEAFEMQKDSSDETGDSQKEEEIATRMPEDTEEPSTIHTIEVIEESGDLFAAPSDSVLIHACNGIGSWGAGIALAFKQNYPNAFKVYQAHCKSSSPKELLGTALLIPPCENSGPRHWVGCLFTSRQVGRRKDTPSRIIQATKPAMEQMLECITNEGKEKISSIFMCKINSGLFNVPWEQSKAIIECLSVDLKNIPGVIKVVSPPS
jgi:ADP-ribose 1''-phosphate phosphatase